MEKYFSNKSLLDLIINWKVHLLIIAVLAGGISIVFSSPYFIKPKFKSMAIVYPDNLGEKSEESHTEQMLEILNSGTIRDNMIEAFKLDEHYKIDQAYKYYTTALYGEYADNVSFRKTENEAVKIEVLDTDPEIACDMVLGIIDFYNKKVRVMHNAKYQEELEVRERELERHSKYVDGLIERMSELGEKYGILDISAQAEGLYTSAKTGTLIPAGKSMDQFVAELGKHGPEFVKLQELLVPTLEALVETRTKYNDAYRELNKEITYSSVITAPYISDKKAEPKRSVIVLMSVMLTLILALIIIGVIENSRNIKPE